MAIKNLLDWLVTDRFILRPQTLLPTSDLEAGRLSMKDGILYTYDEDRLQWLSVHRPILVFGRSGATNNQYLNFSSGGISNKSGYRLLRDTCITGMSVQSSNDTQYTIHLRDNDTASNLVSVPVTNNKGVVVTNLATEISSDRWLQCYLEYTGVVTGAYDPIVMIELAWRG